MDALTRGGPQTIPGLSAQRKNAPAAEANQLMTATEPELIKRARGGDKDAFGELVTRHADRVYATLRRFGLDMTEGEEVA